MKDEFTVFDFIYTSLFVLLSLFSIFKDRGRERPPNHCHILCSGWPEPNFQFLVKRLKLPVCNSVISAKLPFQEISLSCFRR